MLSHDTAINTIVGVLLPLFCAGRALAQTSYSVTPIPPPVGLQIFAATGINRSGQVAGYASDGKNNHPFVGTIAGTTAIPIPSGWSAGAAAINDLGNVVGWAYTGSGQSQAFLGTASGLSLLPLPNGWAYAFGRGINNSNQIVGDGIGPTGQQAFLTVAGGDATVIPLPKGVTSAYSSSVNNSGQVVGTLTNSVGNYQAFIGTSRGVTLVPLPALWQWTSASSINDFGQVAGFGENATLGGQAFVATAGESIPIPLPEGWQNVAQGEAINETTPSINAAGQVVGNGVRGDGSPGGWRWDSANGTHDLNTFVTDGWIIRAAYLINDLGDIVASGSNPAMDFTGLVLLTPTTTTCPVSTSIRMPAVEKPSATSNSALGTMRATAASCRPSIQITLTNPPPNNQYSITDVPSIPTIQATAQIINGTPDQVANTIFSWSAMLEIEEYDDPTGVNNTTVDYAADILQTKTVGSGTYTVTFANATDFRGGALTLFVTATLPDGTSVTGQTPDNLAGGNENPIMILGTNPRRVAIQSYVETHQLSSVGVSRRRGSLSPQLQGADTQDALERIACFESGQTQFSGPPNGGSGLPYVSKSNDIGVFQIHSHVNTDSLNALDVFIDAPNEVFNWQTNVEAALGLYSSKIGYSLRYPGVMRRDSKVTNPKSYAYYIANVVNPARRANGLFAPIAFLPAPNFTTTGNVGADPPNQLLEDSVRGYNGFGSRHGAFDTPFLHEFVPNGPLLMTIPDEQVPRLFANPNVWLRVCSNDGDGTLYGPVGSMDCSIARDTQACVNNASKCIGDPAYINDVAANDPQCPTGSRRN